MVVIVGRSQKERTANSTLRAGSMLLLHRVA